MKKPNPGRDILLLLTHLTYLPWPSRLRPDPERLPQAMRFLPLLGLFSGGLLYLCLRLTVVMPASGAAAVMLGVNLLAGGAFLLRDLMRVAGGTTLGPEAEADNGLFDAEALADNEREIHFKLTRYRVSKTGLIWGLVWLLGLFLIYLYLRQGRLYQPVPLLVAPVAARWLMSWMIYHFPALSPARFRRAMGKRQFALASSLALLVMLPFSSPALFMSVLVAALGVYIFGSFRVRYHGALEEDCYAAVCAWAEALFLLTWISCAHFF